MRHRPAIIISCVFARNCSHRRSQDLEGAFPDSKGMIRLLGGVRGRKLQDWFAELNYDGLRCELFTMFSCLIACAEVLDVDERVIDVDELMVNDLLECLRVQGVVLHHVMLVRR